MGLSARRGEAGGGSPGRPLHLHRVLGEDRARAPTPLPPCCVRHVSVLCVWLDLNNFHRPEGRSSGAATKYRLGRCPAALLTRGACGAFCRPVSGVYFMSHKMSVEASASVGCVSYNCLHFIGYFLEVWGLVWLGSCDRIYLQS